MFLSVFLFYKLQKWSLLNLQARPLHKIRGTRIQGYTEVRSPSFALRHVSWHQHHYLDPIVNVVWLFASCWQIACHVFTPIVGPRRPWLSGEDFKDLVFCIHESQFSWSQGHTFMYSFTRNGRAWPNANLIATYFVSIGGPAEPSWSKLQVSNANC